MLDPRLLRSDPDTVARRLARRSYVFDTARFQSLEAERKHVQQDTETLQADRNRLSREVGQRRGKGEDTADLLAQVGDTGSRLDSLKRELETVQTAFDAFVAGLPNLPDDSVPDGKTEDDSVEVRRLGTPRAFAFPIRDHVTLGEPKARMGLRRRPPSSPAAASWC